MRALTVPVPGGPTALTLTELDRPSPAHGEVRIRVAAAGVNRADANQREGHYPSPASSPPWPGLEVSGTIAELGDGGGEWAIGQRVCALLGGGGYAEDVVVDAGLVLPVPDGVSLVEAAALPEVAATVWSNLFRAAGLRAGQTVLIHGGTSGIGTMAIQLARAAGSHVATTAGSAEKLELCRELGADLLIDYHREDFAERVREVYPRGADVILDIVGGAYAKANIHALAPDGTIMVIANQSGAAMDFNPGVLMAKRGRIWATTLRGRELADKREIIAGVREHVWPLIASGAVRPIVDSTFPFSRADDAHRRLDSDHSGKILLLPGE